MQRSRELVAHVQIATNLTFLVTKVLKNYIVYLDCLIDRPCSRCKIRNLICEDYVGRKKQKRTTDDIQSNSSEEETVVKSDPSLVVVTPPVNAPIKEIIDLPIDALNYFFMPHSIVSTNFFRILIGIIRYKKINNDSSFLKALI